MIQSWSWYFVGFSLKMEQATDHHPWLTVLLVVEHLKSRKRCEHFVFQCLI